MEIALETLWVDGRRLGNYPETGFEEITGDVLEADFWGVCDISLLHNNVGCLDVSKVWLFDDHMGAVILYLSTIRHSRSSPSYTFNSQSAMSVKSGRTIVKSSIPCGISTVLPLAQNPRNLKSAGEYYLGVVNTHFVPNSASTINFPLENGARL